MLRRFIVLAFALLTVCGVSAVPAGAATSPVPPAGAIASGNVNNGPFHKVFTQNLPASACTALRKTYPQASCTGTVTIDVRKVSGPQKPPAGALVATQARPAASTSSYWTYETGHEIDHYGIWSATLTEEVAYHDNCPNANCSDEGVVWNQWIDTSHFYCTGCTISERQSGVINNGKQLSPSGYLNGWENFTVNCGTASLGCNVGHGNRLYFRANGYWWGTKF